MAIQSWKKITAQFSFHLSDTISTNETRTETFPTRKAGTTLLATLPPCVLSKNSVPPHLPRCHVIFKPQLFRPTAPSFRFASLCSRQAVDHYPAFKIVAQTGTRIPGWKLAGDFPYTSPITFLRQLCIIFGQPSSYCNASCHQRQRGCV